MFDGMLCVGKVICRMKRGATCAVLFNVIVLFDVAMTKSSLERVYEARLRAAPLHLRRDQHPRHARASIASMDIYSTVCIGGHGTRPVLPVRTCQTS